MESRSLCITTQVQSKVKDSQNCSFCSSPPLLCLLRQESACCLLAPLPSPLPHRQESACCLLAPPRFLMHREQSVGRWCHRLCWVRTWAAAVHMSGVRCGCFCLHGWVASALRSLVMWSSWLWILSFLWKGLGEKAWSAAADCRELAESWGPRPNRYVQSLMAVLSDGI